MRRLAAFALGLVLGLAVTAHAAGVTPSPQPAPRSHVVVFRVALPAAGEDTAPRRATPAPSAAIPAAPMGVVEPDRRTAPTQLGRASWVRASLGADYLAARLPRGTHVRICGPMGCITGTVNDWGPSSRIRPLRVVDLSAARFTAVCGPLSLGVCAVVVTVG